MENIEFFGKFQNAYGIIFLLSRESHLLSSEGSLKRRYKWLLWWSLEEESTIESILIVGFCQKFIDCFRRDSLEVENISHGSPVVAHKCDKVVTVIFS